MTSDIGLRPAPPPEPIPEASLPWWPFLVLAVLGAVVIVIRFRSRRISLTPEKQLEQAINQARESTADVSVRCLHLQKHLCLYLSARLHIRWRSLTSMQVKDEWEKVFPCADQHFAQQIVEAWKSAEFIEFGRGSIDEKRFSQLIDLAQSLALKLAPKTSREEQEMDRNTPLSSREGSAKPANESVMKNMRSR